MAYNKSCVVCSFYIFISIQRHLLDVTMYKKGMDESCSGGKGRRLSEGNAKQRDSYWAVEGQRWGGLHDGWQDFKSPLGKREILCSTVYAHLTVCSYYFLNMSCRGPGRYLMTVSRMLSSSSSSSSPQPGGIAFFGRVRLPSAWASSAAWASASFSSFFFIPYCRGERTHCQSPTEQDDWWSQSSHMVPHILQYEHHCQYSTFALLHKTFRLSILTIPH